MLRRTADMLRVLLVMVLIAPVAFALVQLYPSGPVSAPGMSIDQPWVQPATLHERFPSLIRSESWSFDFTELESILMDIPFDGKNRPQLSADTGTLLERAAEWRLQQGAAVDDARLEYLISKIMPQPGGDELVALLRDAVYYQREKQRLNENRDSLDAASRHHRLLELQKQAFGVDVAEAFYGERNRLNAYLLARRDVLNDSKLSEAERKNRLAAIEAAFRQQKAEAKERWNEE